MNQGLHSQKTPNIKPSRASYGMPFVTLWRKTDRSIEIPHSKKGSELGLHKGCGLRLFDANPLLESNLIYCQLDHLY